MRAAHDAKVDEWEEMVQKSRSVFVLGALKRSCDRWNGTPPTIENLRERIHVLDFVCKKGSWFPVMPLKLINDAKDGLAADE